jgi:hypothetical protein
VHCFVRAPLGCVARPPPVKEALTGAVAAVQRVDSAIRLNLHFHILGLDGVYVRPDPDHHRGELTFHSLPTPTGEETDDIARRIADRIDAILKKHGRSLDPEESDPDPTEVQLERYVSPYPVLT